jgi:hypothetical protein
VRAGNRYDPYIISDLVLMFANDFAKTTPNAIPHNS